MDNRTGTRGICLQGYIPVRSEPRERAEMVTQILFGEYADILDDEGKWLYVKQLNDGYEGWIDKKCLDRAADTQPLSYLIGKENTRVLDISTGEQAVLPIGSGITDTDNKRFSLAGHTYELEDTGNLIVPGKVTLTEIVNPILAVPYLWGGRSGFGFDCSGLTQYLCRAAGKEIPRDAGDQSALGQTLSFINEAKTGDLAFFDDTEGMISHVGMIIENKRILHASGRVRIDSIDQQGIFNKQTGSYTHKLRVLKRVLDQ